LKQAITVCGNMQSSLVLIRWYIPATLH